MILQGALGRKEKMRCKNNTQVFLCIHQGNETKTHSSTGSCKENSTYPRIQKCISTWSTCPTWSKRRLAWMFPGHLSHFLRHIHNRHNPEQVKHGLHAKTPLWIQGLVTFFFLHFVIFALEIHAHSQVTLQTDNISQGISVFPTQVHCCLPHGGPHDLVIIHANSLVCTIIIMTTLSCRVFDGLLTHMLSPDACIMSTQVLHTCVFYFFFLSNR